MLEREERKKFRVNAGGAVVSELSIKKSEEVNFLNEYYVFIFLFFF